MKKILLLITFSLILNQAFSQKQQQDTIKPKHSPKLAMTMSAVLPGLGQAYNKKYWKIPIIYGGMGALAYLAIKNNHYYQDFKTGYITLYETDPSGSYFMYNREYNLSGLEAGKNYYRRYRDMYTIFTVGIYVLNIVDAAVDAHLYDFDISDDLSLKVQPEFIPIAQNNSMVPGFKICLSIEK